MIFARDYQRPFWRGFFHAVAISLYCSFIALVLLSLKGLFYDEIGPVIRLVFMLFLLVLSAGVCGYLIFFEPIKKVLHHHFKASAVMMASTLGWLFVFLIIFLIGLVQSIGY